jgi:hypothetical protein
MQRVAILDAKRSDFETVCAFDLAEAQHTIPMDTNGLGVLADLSWYREGRSRSSSNLTSANR